MTKYEIRYLNFLYLFVTARLTSRQITIMMARFAANQCYPDIAKDYHVTKQCIQEVVKYGCRNLLRSPKVRKILSFLSK